MTDSIVTQLKEKLNQVSAVHSIVAHPPENLHDAKALLRTRVAESDAKKSKEKLKELMGR